MNTIQIVDEDIRTRKITPEVQKKFSDDLTKYAKHISIDRRNTDFFTPISTCPNEGEEKFKYTFNDILNSLEEIEKRIVEHYADTQQDCQIILEATKLTGTKLLRKKEWIAKFSRTISIRLAPTL